MFPAILSRSRSFWKIACAQSPNTASSEHLNERVWTKDVSKKESPRWLPFITCQFQSTGFKSILNTLWISIKFSLNAPHTWIRVPPFWLLWLICFQTVTHTKGAVVGRVHNDIWSLCGCRNSTISSIHGCRPILVIIFDLVPTGIRSLVKVNFCPVWDVKQCANMPRNRKSDWGRWSSESKTVPRVLILRAELGQRFRSDH